MIHKYHNPSSRPREIIEMLARRPDQPKTMREYQDGYSSYLGLIPVLENGDKMLEEKTAIAGLVMQLLAKDINDARNSSVHWASFIPEDYKFARTILAVEEPYFGPSGSVPDGITREGVELLVAHWGKGFTSPIHGHAPGLLHEEVLAGQILVRQFRHTEPGKVVPVRMDIASKGTLVSQYSPPDTRGGRMGLVHNFTALTPALSLHFVPEHTRDGRDNTFVVEYFDDVFPLTNRDVTQINVAEGMRLPVGSVCLVRSKGVAYYGDHYIVITGGSVVKPHGIRPADVAIPAPKTNCFLDGYQMTDNGLILLRLNPEATTAFWHFHQLKWSIDGKSVLFPSA